MMRQDEVVHQFAVILAKFRCWVPPSSDDRTERCSQGFESGGGEPTS
jgi:hypothetical protein